MQLKTNTDIFGGIVVLAIAAIFYVQLGDGFSPYGTFFPERILPVLVALGIILLIKGLVKKNENKKSIFKINRTMLLSMVIGAAWALLLDFSGFILTSFVSLTLLILAYSPREKRTTKYVLVNCIGIFVVVLVFYYAFSHVLGVTLPTGAVFSHYR